jgi:hypothetical protein
MPASPLTELPRPLAVVCNDAGGANLILPFLATDPLADARAVMAGPAERLWRARYGDSPLMELDAALDGAAALLSGTGWASDLEHQARARAKAAGIRSIAVLDHWTDYPDRFVRGGETVAPDEYWVVDEDAFALASCHFPDATVRLVPNLYLDEQLAGIRPLDEGSPPRVLYVLEPARSEWGRGIPGEFQALDYWLANMGAAGLDRSVPVCLRPHPSDPPGKYDEWLGRQRGIDVAMDELPDLAEAISRATVVAGGQTVAMAVALAAGRQVISTLPPWAPPCALPHSGIIHLSSLIKPGTDDPAQAAPEGL